MQPLPSQTGIDLSDVKPSNTAVLIIDMSCDFIAPGAPMESRDGREMTDRLASLLNTCRETGAKVIYVNHVHQAGAHDMGTLAERFPTIAQGRALRGGSKGVEIWPPLAPQEGDLVIDKIRQSGFMYTSLEAVLRELGIRNVVVAGVSVGACVECTARDAVARDFHVIMLSDGTAGSSLPDFGWGGLDSASVQKAFLSNFAYHFGRVASCQDLAEALRR